MLLTLVRHGPTQWNALGRFQGRTDVPLSVEGRRQARALAEALRDEHYDRIYSSDLERASETARIVAESRDLEIFSDPRLREFDFGRWEGLTWDEIGATSPQVVTNDATGVRQYAAEGGETFEQVRSRLGSFLADLERENLGAVLIVTHAGPLHAIFALLDLTPAVASSASTALKFAPGGITRIAREKGAAQLLDLNDLRYVDEQRA
jgi:broad specificity phosphatase PhoE